MGGVYAIPAIFMDVRGAFTNTVPIDAYRGAGKPEANYVIERLVDIAALRLGSDPVSLRRRNLITEFPHHSALGMTIDCGRFAANLDDAAARAEVADFPARRAAAAARGQLRGLGVGCFLETARGTPNEGAEIRFDPDGPCFADPRHPVQWAGPRDELSADRGEAARAAYRDLPSGSGRYADGQGGCRPWRRSVDAPRRHGLGEGSRGGQRKRPCDGGRTASGRYRRCRMHGRSVPREGHAPQVGSAAG